LTNTPYSGYLGIPLYLVMILSYKLVKKSKRVRPETADLFSGKDKIDREEEEFIAQQAAKNQNKKGGSWYYRHFVGWLF
jgi:amino acid transporter